MEKRLKGRRSAGCTQKRSAVTSAPFFFLLETKGRAQVTSRTAATLWATMSPWQDLAVLSHMVPQKNADVAVKTRAKTLVWICRPIHDSFHQKLDSCEVGKKKNSENTKNYLQSLTNIYYTCNHTCFLIILTVILY